jgi:hypothetical protein
MNEELLYELLWYKESFKVVQDLEYGVVDYWSFQRKSIIKNWDGNKTKDFKIFYISTLLGLDFSWFFLSTTKICLSCDQNLASEIFVLTSIFVVETKIN